MSTKGERTRQHLMDVAIAAFERDGFANTSMRALAKEAGVSVGLAYRYFDAKEAIVLAFYEQKAEELLQVPVTGGTLGARFHSVMRARFTLLRPHHRAMSAVLAAMLDPEGPVGALSPATARLRGMTQQVLRDAISGTPGLRADLHEPLLHISWLGHLLLMLAWVQRPDAAEQLTERVAAGLDMAQPFLGMPFAKQALTNAAGALAGFVELGPTSEAGPPA